MCYNKKRLGIIISILIEWCDILEKGIRYSNLNYVTAYDLIKKILKKDGRFKYIMMEILEIMGIVLDIDFLEFDIVNHRYSFLENHVWKKRGIEIEQFVKMKSVFTQDSLFNIYCENEYIKINDTRKLPKEFSDLYKLLQIKSICIFPIKIENEIVAEFTLKYHFKTKSFKDDQIDFTSKCVNLIEKRINKDYLEIKFNLNQNYFLDIIDNFIYPFALIDYDYNLVKVNQEFENFFNITIQDLNGLDFFEFISGSERNQIVEVINKSKTKEKEDCEIFKLIKQEKKIIRIIPFPIASNDMKLLGIMFKDVTKFKMKEKQLIKMAYFDLATDLHNKNYYFNVCQKLDKMNYETLGVIVFDIDYLKHINHLYGHAIGDQIIIDISDALKIVFVNDYLISRVGDDEFKVFVLNQTEDCMINKIEQVQKIVKEQAITKHVSFGYSFTEMKVKNIKDIIHQADNKMQINKKDRKSFEEIQRIINRPTV